MKWRAILFGLNYKHCPEGHLEGAINDTHTMGNLLLSLLGGSKDNLAIYTDDVDLQDTSHTGIVQSIYKLTHQALVEKLELVIIHYSGHGSYVTDSSGDEEDSRDEVICPSDFLTAGMIKDDILSAMLSYFPKTTRVITIFDSCHSGSVTDLKYRWNGTKKNIENRQSLCYNNIISLSGCSDTQTSADAMINHSAGGAMTVCLCKVIKKDPSLCYDIFKLVRELRIELMNGGYDQVPQLCSSYDLVNDKVFLPIRM